MMDPNLITALEQITEELKLSKEYLLFLLIIVGTRFILWCWQDVMGKK